jgi:acyl-coenzyme A thioesterase PaaI-like protein
VDVVTTAALVSVSDFSGVSLDLNTSYLNPAKDGDVVDVDAHVLKAGGAVGVIACSLRSRATGRAVAEGRHTKYLPRTEVGPQLERMLRSAGGTAAGAAAVAQPRAKL